MRLGNILDEATRVLHEHRHMVLAIAHALETYKTISADDVAAIFEGRQGPKVNGRDYHHPSFIEVADRYHNEALVAHRMTGRVEVPLPALSRGNRINSSLLRSSCRRPTSSKANAP